MKQAPEKFDRWVLASVLLHAGVVLFVFVAPSLFEAKTATWGSKAGGDGSVNVKIVNSMSGIALPSPPVAAPEAPVSEDKSPYQSEPAPKVTAPQKSDPNALQLPSKNAPKKPAEVPTKTASNTPPAAQPANAIAYGAAGGSPALRYGTNATGTGPTGAEFGGDGSFGEQFGPYVRAMTTAISDAWVKGSSTLTQQQAPRVYVTFKIARDGSVSDVNIEKASNQSVLDRAAEQAIRRAQLPKLPSDYRGDTVSVRFYFDYGK